MENSAFGLRLVFTGVALSLVSAALVSCSPDQREISNPVTEIVFPNGTAMDLDLPVPTPEFFERLERGGATFETYPIESAPAVNGIDATQVYKIYTRFDTEEQVQRQYFAYERDELIMHVEASFAYPNPY